MPNVWPMVSKPETARRIRAQENRMELRLNEIQWEGISPDDQVVFYEEPGFFTELLRVKVLGVVKSPSFVELFATFPVAAYFQRPVQELLEVIQIHYPDAQQKLRGVLGLIVEPMD